MSSRNNGQAPLVIFPFAAWLPSVTVKSLASDLVAGLTNAIMVVPQGVAFAMIAGLPPEYGLYTAIVPPIIAGLFGSSRHLISGPATAMSIVTYSAISPYAGEGTAEFVTLAFTLTFLAGLIQFAFGVARMGALVNFISRSVVVGFTAGAAILIATSQFGNITGISVARGESFLHVWFDIFKGFSHFNPYSLIVAIVTVAVVIFFKIFRPRWPGMILGMIAGGVTAAFLGAQEKGIALVGSLPSSLPPLSAPDLSAQTLHNIAPGALAISILGLIEAVSIARSIALKSGQRIDGDQEFIGQGLANIVGSFFSCYASSGSFTRSGLNYDSGAKTPMSAVFAGTSLALILLMVAPWAAYLPLPAMGGIVLVVAYNLIDYRQIKVILKASKTDSAVLIVTFLATLFVKLEFAIYVGVILSLVLYLNRTSKPAVVTRAPDPASPRRNLHTISSGPECSQMKIVRVDGSLYFGSVNHVEEDLELISSDSAGQTHMLMVCSGINFIDVAGAEMLLSQAVRLKEMGGGLYLYGLKRAVRETMEKGGYFDKIGRENIFDSKREAINEITARLKTGVCKQCADRIFTECADFAGPDKKETQ